jgi:hypothetical protein
VNPLELFEKLINEHGSASILRERLGLLRDQYAAQERMCVDLQAQNTQLQARLEQSERRAADLEKQLHALKERTMSRDVCDNCGSPEIVRVGTRPHPTFGALGLREAAMHCGKCGHDTFIELPLK